MIKDSLNIKDRQCEIYNNIVRDNVPDYIVIQPVSVHDTTSLDKQTELMQSDSDCSFLLAAMLINDWNRELSPWEAPAVFNVKRQSGTHSSSKGTHLPADEISDDNEAPQHDGAEGFGNGAGDTLSFIERDLIPDIRRRYNMSADIPVILGGYSLAGLFSLWSAYQTDIFSAVAAVSPSVWFPGWVEYAENNEPHVDNIYLSLGDREERTGNPIMRTVGECIRRQYSLLEDNDNITGCILEWNPGNHFRDVHIRCARGFAWCENAIS